MKLLMFIVTLFSSVTLSNNYLTKEQEFIKNCNDAYKEYIVLDYELAVGDLIIVCGEVDGDTSFSVYFKNGGYPKYQVKIITSKSSVKEYVLSDYEDYQIYYNINVKSNTKYYLELINQDTNLVYNRYLVFDSSKMDRFDQSLIIQGNNHNNFPYETKLSTKLTFFQKVGLIIGIIVIVEIAFITFVFLKKKKKKNKQIKDEQRKHNIVYESHDYIVEDNEDED